MDLKRWLDGAATAIADWQAGFAPFTAHPSLQVSDEQLAGVFAEFTDRLGAGNYPYFHPDYAGQMLKPPHPVAVAGYLAAMLINPNNHALDGGRATSEMEKEAVAQLAAMFGLPAHLGHLTSSGTIANLEALYVARELSPGLAIACSEEAHYTHARMAGLLGIPAVKVAVDERGRIDPAALDEVLARGEVGTVVATAGTTGLGAIDPVHEILAVARRHGVRVHVDAAYGGFFTLLAGRADRSGLEPEPWRAISACDSVVVDPHKHGLQPYGCGAVLFRDPSVGRLYKHDSPYTYFTSGDLHLGEISLECSRAGAAAAALWLTLRSLDLAPILSAGVRAARAWADLLRDSDELRLHIEPQLDIVAYFPDRPRASEIDAASERVLDAGMTADDPVFLSTLRIDGDAFAAAHPDVEMDTDGVRVLRSVLMKPEHEPHVPWLHERVSVLVRDHGA